MSIQLEIATTGISITKLSHKWKNGSFVKVIATIKKSAYWKPGQRHDNETIEFLMTELEEGEGQMMVKKMNVDKFYTLFYHMTELIPLFSYLERLNALKNTMQTFEG